MSTIPPQPPQEPWPPPQPVGRYPADQSNPGAVPPSLQQINYGQRGGFAQLGATPVLPAGPSGGTQRQWEARVRQMVRRGSTRDEILSLMGESNWPFEEANNLVLKIVSKERWMGIWSIVAGLVVGLLGGLIFLADLNSKYHETNGGEFTFMFLGLAGVIFGLVRLTKVRA